MQAFFLGFPCIYFARSPPRLAASDLCDRRAD
jgi:hypothetical protein